MSYCLGVCVCVISNQTKLKKVELAIYGDLYKIGD